MEQMPCSLSLQPDHLSEQENCPDVGGGVALQLYRLTQQTNAHDHVEGRPRGELRRREARRVRGFGEPCPPSGSDGGLGEGPGGRQ